MAKGQLSYEDEQQRLRAEYDGKPSQDIHIEVPKEPEVNPEVYKDVEPMLYRGFLTVAAEINGVYFVFKSLNHHEFELLRFSGVFQDKGGVTDFWNTFLAYGVFMVDGSNILSDRERLIPKLASTFSELPKEARAKIIRYVSEVNRRASTSVVLTESYAMETVSRYRWMQIRGLDLTSTSVTGIEGTQRLGLNWAQQLWRALNLVEDRNEQQERDWENAKFIGSCFAGKGMSKIYSQDTERRKKEKEERLARKDKLLREIILGEKIPEKAAIVSGAVMTMPRTVEELASQLERDLRGDKDWHDKVIEEHERSVRENYARQRQQQEEAAKGNSRIFGDKDVFGGSELEGMTAQEVEAHIQRKKQLQVQTVSQMKVYNIPDEKTQVFLDKWGVAGPEVNTERSVPDRNAVRITSLPSLENSTKK
jgi:hypothetical protein